MENNKVIELSSFSRKPGVQKYEGETDKLLSGFRQLSRREKETLFTLLDVFLRNKRALERA